MIFYEKEVGEVVKECSVGVLRALTDVRILVVQQYSTVYGLHDVVEREIACPMYDIRFFGFRDQLEILDWLSPPTLGYRYATRRRFALPPFRQSKATFFCCLQ